VRTVVFPGDILSAVTQPEAAQLSVLAAGKIVLELGAQYGYSTIVLASVADLVYSVDWHQGDPHAGEVNSWEIFTGNLTRYGVTDRVIICRGRFEEEVPALAAQGIRVDGAFLDGMHDKESVTRDLALALLLVKPGGFVCWHDYGRSAATGHPGFEVTEVADEFGVDGVVGCLAWGTVPAL
jgi:predicted O-methyltransferase YrrM